MRQTGPSQFRHGAQSQPEDNAIQSKSVLLSWFSPPEIFSILTSTRHLSTLTPVCQKDGNQQQSFFMHKHPSWNVLGYDQLDPPIFNEAVEGFDLARINQDGFLSQKLASTLTPDQFQKHSSIYEWTAMSHRNYSCRRLIGRLFSAIN